MRVLKVIAWETLINEIPVLVLAAVPSWANFIPERLTVGLRRGGKSFSWLFLSWQVRILVLGGFYYQRLESGRHERSDAGNDGDVSGMSSVVMAGSFVIMELVMWWAGSYLESAGLEVGINGTAVSGMPAFSFLPLPGVLHDERHESLGKVVYSLFRGKTSAGGGHLSCGSGRADFIRRHACQK